MTDKTSRTARTRAAKTHDPSKEERERALVVHSLAQAVYRQLAIEDATAAPWNSFRLPVAGPGVPYPHAAPANQAAGRIARWR